MSRSQKDSISNKETSECLTYNRQIKKVRFSRNQISIM